MTAATASSAKVLSSNDLNARLKAKEYSSLLPEVRRHLKERPVDAVSALKFLTAFAFHAFHNRLEDAGAAALAAECAAESYSVLEKAAAIDPASVQKAAAAANNIVFKGFLRDCWLKCAMSVSTAAASFFGAAGDSGLSGFFSEAAQCVGAEVSEACLRCGPDAARDARRLLRANQLASSHLSTRIMVLRVLRLEMLVFCARQRGGEAVPKVKEAVLSALQHVGENPPQNAAREVFDRIFVLCAKLGEILLPSARARQPLREALESARDFLAKSFKEDRSNPPPPRSLTVWCHLFETELESGPSEGGGAEALLSELAALSSDCEGEEDGAKSRQRRVFRAFVAHGRFRLR